MKYLVDWRMTLARDLLLTQNLPMTKIAVGPVALGPDTGQLPEPMMLMVVMMGVPSSCLGQLGCEGLARRAGLRRERWPCR